MLRETRYQDLIDALDSAKNDARIAVIVLDLEHLTGVSPAHLSGLGDALSAAKAAGKEIVSVGDYYTQGQYYLASFADTIYMHSMGQVLLTGFGSYQTYYKDLLDKLKVKVHVFRVGAYKAAVEPYTRTDMSPEAREANRAMIDELWQDYIAKVSANRKIALDQMNDYVLHYEDLLKTADGDMARVALEHGLVDALISRDEMRQRLIAKVGESEGTFRQIASTDYLRATRAVQPPTDNEVGVVVASGMILPGEQPRGSIGADSLTELIRNARLDQHVKAVVLRVDSPGGAAISSEVIRQELEQLQTSGKPLVISMAGVAASGGYWISATADEIWAAPTTVTGSIGIFGMVPTFEDSLAADRRDARRRWIGAARRRDSIRSAAFPSRWVTFCRPTSKPVTNASSISFRADATCCRSKWTRSDKVASGRVARRTNSVSSMVWVSCRTPSRPRPNAPV